MLLRLALLHDTDVEIEGRLLELGPESDTVTDDEVRNSNPAGAMMENRPSEISAELSSSTVMAPRFVGGGDGVAAGGGLHRGGRERRCGAHAGDERTGRGGGDQPPGASDGGGPFLH
jgi:hypothetical protein